MASIGTRVQGFERDREREFLHPPQRWLGVRVRIVVPDTIGAQRVLCPVTIRCRTPASMRQGPPPARRGSGGSSPKLEKLEKTQRPPAIFFREYRGGAPAECFDSFFPAHIVGRGRFARYTEFFVAKCNWQTKNDRQSLRRLTLRAYDAWHVSLHGGCWITEMITPPAVAARNGPSSLRRLVRLALRRLTDQRDDHVAGAGVVSDS